MRNIALNRIIDASERVSATKIMSDRIVIKQCGDDTIQHVIIFQCVPQFARGLDA